MLHVGPRLPNQHGGLFFLPFLARDVRNEIGQRVGTLVLLWFVYKPKTLIRPVI